MTTSLPTRSLLALSHLRGVGPAALKKAAALPCFWEREIGELSAAVAQIGRALRGDPEPAWQMALDWADEQIAHAEGSGCDVFSAVDDEYPKSLSDTPDDPFLIFVKGRLPPHREKVVAVIGTREPTRHGELIAERCTRFFVEEGWSVVSGLALGCDAIAHRVTLDAGGHTVAVLAHGLQTVTPSSHRQLAEDIVARGGAIVSEYPFGRDVHAAQFVRRDRTQAALARGVLMVQSDRNGGSLHASRAALSYQRWLAVPYPTDRDRQNSESKIQANLLLADGPDVDRADLLKCPLGALELVKIIRSREDYVRLISAEVVGRSRALLSADRSLDPNGAVPESSNVGPSDVHGKSDAVSDSSTEPDKDCSPDARGQVGLF